jgi:cation diffusion facilitator family transporter
MSMDKQKVALSSVIAAVGLTASKLVVGLLTGSLGILSEALHSGLDLFAAVITLFAVRASDKPADAKHHYGHGKVENFSALVETLLLLITCVWIIYEAVKKLLGETPDLVGAQWGALLIIVCIVVDISRSRALMKAAKQHNSQALKADALHFGTDVWSSSVVLAGLICVWIGNMLHLEFLKYADPIAALGVAGLVVWVSLKLGRETVESLLDTAPKGMREKVEREVGSVSGVLQVADIRVRPSGAHYYIDVSVGIDPDLSQKMAHRVVSQIKERISAKIPRSDVVVGTFPASVGGAADAGVNSALENIVSSFPNCANAHNIHVYELGGRRKITAHVELLENLTLKESHELSHRISDAVQAALPGVDYVNLYFQRAQEGVRSEEVTAARGDLAEKIKAFVAGMSEGTDCHDIQLFKSGEGVSAFLHCGVPEDVRMDRLEEMSSRLKTGLRKALPELEHVHIHFEPAEEE